MRLIFARPSYYGYSARLLLTLCIASWLVPAPSLSADWTEYRGPAGDGVSPESLAIDTARSSLQPKVHWKVATPAGFSSFVVADGRAFTLIGSRGLERDSNLGSAAGGRADSDRRRETLLALDAGDGRTLWTRTLGSADYNHDGGNSGSPGNRGGDGPRSTPATDGRRVYVYDGHLVLSCFEAPSGQLLWQRDIVQEFDGRNIKWFNALSPILDGDRVYVSGGGPGQTFLAFHKLTGELIWKSGDELNTHATPRLATIADRQQLVFFMQSGLVGIAADNGKRLWDAGFPFSVSTAASPVVEENLVYCSAGYGVGAACFRIRDDGEDQAAEEVWFKANQLMNHWSTPVVYNGHLYGIYEFKKYGTAPLQCVELSTGQIKWSQRGFGPGNCILVGAQLVVLSDDGRVTVVAAEPSGYQAYVEAKIIDGKCWSSPAFSEGRVYVRSTKEGACFTF